MTARRIRAGLLAAGLLTALGLPGIARAAEECFLVTELKTARVAAKQGLCAARHSPVETFDIPLALLGYEAGFLRSEREPVLNPPAPMAGVPPLSGPAAEPQTPQGWVRHQVAWYGGAVARAVGRERLAAGLHAFLYGNENLSGDPGVPDGFAQSWLSSSLAISPREQVDFLRKMLNGELPVPAEAVGRTVALLKQPETPAGYELFGVSGTGHLRLADAVLDRSRPLGWFVGWAEKGGRTFVFVRFMSLDIPADEPLGVRARRQTLSALAAVLAAQER
ncbi:class D beta-lactamase [Aquabacter cavernae]|uniref:class D beta-lactamase n=1 Tax=Aquabacter cavernae TaxID=2496029 RepID=UPI000F8CA563|nr:class D beta-lactamase [Aquabacter cavernae]